MSESFDRAVDARLDAYRPDTVPPFSAIEARRRARDRRRMAVGAGALSVVALVGGGLIVPSLTGDRLTGPPMAGPAATPTVTVDDQTTRYGLGYVDLDAYDAGRDEPLMEACLALPGTSEVSVDESLPPGYSVLLTGSEQTATFERCAADLDNVAVRNLDATPSSIRWTGVQVCPTKPTGPCRDVDADTANRIYDALALDSRRQVDPNGPRCRASDAQTYSLLFSHPSADVQEILVPTGPCSPVRVGIAAYEVDQSPSQLVRQAYDAAAAREQATPCLSGDSTEPPGYVGLTEQQALDLAAREGLTVEVVGRDGTCSNMRTDLRADRINLDLVNGRVARASRS